MIINTFKCKCGKIIESHGDNPKCICGCVVGLKELFRVTTRPGNRITGKSAKGDFVNLCSEGDFRPFYSYDLGVQINSSSQLKKVLKNRGMVCLTDAREKRDYDKEMLERARSGEFDKCERK